MWLSRESINSIKKSVYKYISNNELVCNIFTHVYKYINDRIYICQFGNKELLLKMEEIGDDSDNMNLEYNVGVEINGLRNDCPYFVGTIAYIEGNITGSKIRPLIFDDVSSKFKARYLLLEKIDGKKVNVNFSLQKHLRIFIQVAMALHHAYNKMKFTHYNLHHGNVVVKKLDVDVIITLCGLSIQTDIIPVIIDYGRSFTNKTGGHIMVSKGVYPKSCWQHDIYLYLCNTLSVDHYEALNTLLKFYNLHFNRNKSLYKQLKKIDKQKPIYRTPEELLHFIEKTFSFVPIYNNRIILYKPIDDFYNNGIITSKLKNPSDSDLINMKKIIKKYKY